MEIKENGQYKTVEFKTLIFGDVFVFAENVYIVCEKGLDSAINPCNVVSLKTGEFAYFSQETLVSYYPNAILNL